MNMNKYENMNTGAACHFESALLPSSVESWKPQRVTGLRMQLEPVCTQGLRLPLKGWASGTRTWDC